MNFDASGMRWIDFSCKITLITMILEEKSKIFIFSLQYKKLISLNQGSIFKLRECAQSILRLEKPKNRRFSHKNPKMFDFRFNTSISLNQGQGSIFTLRECAQSVFRMKLPPKIWFWRRNFKKFLFSLNTHIYFPESGSRKHFHASGMRAIDFSHNFTLI